MWRRHIIRSWEIHLMWCDVMVCSLDWDDTCGDMVWYHVVHSMSCSLVRCDGMQYDMTRCGNYALLSVGTFDFSHRSSMWTHHYGCLSVCLSVYLSVCLCICLSVYLSVCLRISHHYALFPPQSHPSAFAHLSSLPTPSLCATPSNYHCSYFYAHYHTIYHSLLHSPTLPLDYTGTWCRLHRWSGCIPLAALSNLHGHHRPAQRQRDAFGGRDVRGHQSG